MAECTLTHRHRLSLELSETDECLMTQPLKAVRGRFLHCLDDPLHSAGAGSTAGGEQAIQYLDDGYLILEAGHIVSLEPANTTTLPKDCELIDHRGHWIVPGFIDTHVHYPQADVIASHGSQLLDWLERYTFPAEMRFSDPDFAADTARFFLDQLLANGTTTALVFATVHPGSVTAFFEEAERRSLRMISGKVMMDRHAPPGLLDTVESSYRDSKQLIQTWHGRGRLGYAVTPRFAPTSTGEQLEAAARLLDEHPGVHMHTHLAENPAECDWVAELFPDRQDYLAVYEHYRLVRKRSVFAHSLHLSHDAWQRMGRSGAAVSHCPCSNLGLGSGLFDLNAAQAAKVPVGLGTDVGGGDSYSIMRNINEAYKIQQLQHRPLSPEQAFYMGTLGGARALDLDSHIGNFEPGKEADFVVLNPEATPLLARRTQAAKDWREQLFSLLMLGDDRAVLETYILGEPAKRRISPN